MQQPMTVRLPDQMMFRRARYTVAQQDQVTKYSAMTADLYMSGLSEDSCPILRQSTEQCPSTHIMIPQLRGLPMVMLHMHPIKASRLYLPISTATLANWNLPTCVSRSKRSKLVRLDLLCSARYRYIDRQASTYEE